jgi:hypothetical protein
MEPVRNAPQCLQCSRPNADPEICRSRGSRSRSRNGDNWDEAAIAGGGLNDGFQQEQSLGCVLV